MNIGPTFFSGPTGDHTPGDHTPGDGLTRLQTSFAGASSADISSYAIGSGVITGAAVVSDGQLDIPMTPGNTTALTWTNSDLGRLTYSPLTFEYFVRFNEVTVNPASSLASIISFYNVDGMSSGGAYSGYHQLDVTGLIGGINQIVGGLNTWYSWVSGVDAFDPSVFHHVAYVWDAVNPGTLSVYFDGVRVVSRSGAYIRISGTTSVILGGYSSPGGGVSMTMQIKGVRVRRAAMYSGASFVPPVSPSAWGPP